MIAAFSMHSGGLEGYDIPNTQHTQHTDILPAPGLAKSGPEQKH